jgi:radical SAM superfamily enzyme YgiQ (UPF0313 family)
MKPKVILYHPRSNPGAKRILPMTLLALGAVLENEFDYVIVDANDTSDPLAHMDQLVRDDGYNVLAATVMPGPQLLEAVNDTRELKRRHPGVTSVWGGYFPTQHGDTCLAADYVDFTVRSQGELTFVELLRALAAGGDLGTVKGLSWKRNGEVVHNAPRELTSPDKFPEWPYDRLDVPRYLNRNYMGSRVIEHHSSYGCPFACNFCAVVSMSNRRWLPESPARMERVLRRLRDSYGADAVNFHDMDFFVSEGRTAEFAERIRDFGMHWWGLGRIDTLLAYKDSTWQKMKASGLKMVFSGAESGSDEVLKRMNKGGKASTHATLEYVRRIKDFGIVPELSWVMGNPPDPLADIRRTMEFIREVKRINPATEIILYIYTPVPLDGNLYNTAREHGFKFPETLDEWTSGHWREFSLRRTPGVPWLDHSAFKLVRDFEAVINAYYPTVTDIKLQGLKRQFSRAIASWRYLFEFYNYPVELKAWQKLVHYQRPETTGF